jgi:hypothetical protein
MHGHVIGLDSVLKHSCRPQAYCLYSYALQHRTQNFRCDVLIDFRVVSAQSWQLLFGSRWSFAGNLFHSNDNY